MTIGWQNASDAAKGNATKLNVTDIASEIGGMIGSSVAGNPELVGPLVLGLFGFVLYREDVPMDVSAAVMVPTVFFLGNYGFIPYGDGVLWGVILSAAALFAFGLADYMGR